jgi:acetylglutamate kinase
LAAITCEQVEKLVQSRVVSGGMVLKLEAAKRALEGGVREVRIVGGTTPYALLHALDLHSAEQIPESVSGTRVLREPLSWNQAAMASAL